MAGLLCVGSGRAAAAAAAFHCPIPWEAWGGGALRGLGPIANDWQVTRHHLSGRAHSRRVGWLLSAALLGRGLERCFCAWTPPDPSGHWLWVMLNGLLWHKAASRIAAAWKSRRVFPTWGTKHEQDAVTSATQWGATSSPRGCRDQGVELLVPQPCLHTGESHDLLRK